MREQWIGGRYKLLKRVHDGASSHGIPELWLAQDAGDNYFVKVWRRPEGASDEIRALWNREVRSLSRLQGYPGASELFVRLHDLGVSEDNYYVVLDGGRRVLLANILQNRSRYNWLLNLTELGRRRPIWEGLLRVAEALSILHSEGTLHRSLSSWSVFSGPDGAADFRLSGFEWSLRISGDEGAPKKVRLGYALKAAELLRPEADYSIATDWFDFGLLVAEVFGFNVRQTKKVAGIRSAIKDSAHLREAEKDAILHFLEDEVERRVSSSEAATLLLKNIVRELNVSSIGSNRSLILALRLGSDVDLSRTVEAVSLGSAPALDPIKQREWIEQDLKGDVRVVARMNPVPTFIVKGSKLEYRVRQWDVDGLRTWDFGFCEAAESIPRVMSDDQVFSLSRRKLETLLYPNVRKSRQRIRDRSASWDKVFPFRANRVRMAPHLRDVHDFFRVTQQLDTVLTAAQICPVRILSVERLPTQTEISLTPFVEKERDELATYLRLGFPAEQLRDWFKLGVEAVSAEDEEGPKRDSYELLDRRTISSDTSIAVVWKFTDAAPGKDGPIYRFRCQGSVPQRIGNFYLARNFGGTIAQIRRRHKAIEDMRTHEDLLRLLADPLQASRPTGASLPSERTPIRLDPSKISCLESIWSTQPSFIVQGPPGTGKTTLIQAFVDRLLGSDPTAQVLITAHSHHTVDDVRQKLKKLSDGLGDLKRPIMIRVGAREPSEHDVMPVTKDILLRLQRSDLFKSAPAFLQDRIESASDEEAVRHDKFATEDFRTMQLLVQHAANLTFSTSNSSELADLSSRGRRFDWSIIEEAGKAHGFDMAAALQASHRLLFIGDHFQLRPFNARLYKELLSDPLRVRKAIHAGVQFASGLVDPTLVDDQEDRDSFEDRCDKWRRMVDVFAELFEKSTAGESVHKSPAATLTDQHRMHPDIAEVVGKVFYPDGSGGTLLNSPEETKEKFLKDPPFIIREGSWLPHQRIVWCNVDWVQKKEFSIGETDGLFASPIEASLVVSVLQEIWPRGREACEIQILSPYNDQLHAIRERIEAAKNAGFLDHMFEHPFDLRMDKRLGATVDEFQGSEADVVIVSLVRNNGLVPWQSIGFLKESNRMNVLLSRARQKLIIVGSWQFFKTRCNENTPADAEYGYIKTLMDVMEEAEKAKQLACYPKLP